MDDDTTAWLNKFLRINTTGRKSRDAKLMSETPRKGPHRLDGILKADKYALIVTNRRARAGLKPTKISR